MWVGFIQSVEGLSGRLTFLKEKGILPADHIWNQTAILWVSSLQENRCRWKINKDADNWYSFLLFINRYTWRQTELWISIAGLVFMERLHIPKTHNIAKNNTDSLTLIFLGLWTPSFLKMSLSHYLWQDSFWDLHISLWPFRSWLWSCSRLGLN